MPFSAAHPGTWRTGETMPPLAIVPSRSTDPQVELSYRVDDQGAAFRLWQPVD